MWNDQKNMRNGRMEVSRGCAAAHSERREPENRKLSGAMAMILGLAVTLEVIVAAGMIFNIDFHSTDTIALIFLFMVLYAGIVSLLTDK
ncbi:MAG: hypothetical protein SO401_08075 [Blautia sp.]|nr:hypothetical protein [Blautia sp.]